MGVTITPVPPFPGLNDWAKLISFRPTHLTQATINLRFGSLVPPSPRRLTHSIEDAKGPISLDFYPVQISKLPVIGGRPMTPEALLEHIRRNLDTFVNNRPDGCLFNMYEPLIDGPVWTPPFLSTGLVGAVISIDIFDSGVNLDDGSVVVSEIDVSHWVFSTIWTPNDLAHPVSGNREFGFQAVGSGFVFYTRGADRCTGVLDDLFANKVFAGADRLWRSFQIKVASFVNGNDGVATEGPPVANRYDWLPVQTDYHRPTVTWVV
jgi:hypothetical protein